MSGQRANLGSGAEYDLAAPPALNVVASWESPIVRAGG